MIFEKKKITRIFLRYQFYPIKLHFIYFVVTGENEVILIGEKTFTNFSGDF
jgi:hypothetical protein